MVDLIPLKWIIVGRAHINIYVLPMDDPQTSNNVYKKENNIQLK